MDQLASSFKRVIILIFDRQTCINIPVLFVFFCCKWSINVCTPTADLCSCLWFHIQLLKYDTCAAMMLTWICDEREPMFQPLNHPCWWKWTCASTWVTMWEKVLLKLWYYSWNVKFNLKECLHMDLFWRCLYTS